MKILEFKDIHKNTYIYNDDSGLILEADNELISIFQNETINSDNISENTAYYIYFKNMLENLCKQNKTKNIIFTDDYLKNYGLKQLTFKLTDDCNMRCKYCVYSSHYPNMSTYSKKKLSLDTAKKAIDIYMEYFMDNKNNSPLFRNEPTFTFFGGEPMLEFNLLKNIVLYIEKKYSMFNPLYTITTNGLCFNKYNSEFLKKHNFYISLSIDGDKENHDRNRINIRGEETYDIIMNNVNKFFNNYKHIASTACYDYNTDLIKMDNLVTKNVQQPRLQKITLINDNETTYYNQFSADNEENTKKQIGKLINEYAKKLIAEEEPSILTEALIGTELQALYDRIKFKNGHLFFSNNTSNCVPGSKLYVQVDGSFTICERVAPFKELIIGNVNDGINIDYIKKLMDKYSKEVLVKCSKCPISNICNQCFANTNIKSGNFTIDKKYCEQRIDAFKLRFSILTYILQNNPNAFDFRYAKSYIQSNERNKIYETN